MASKKDGFGIRISLLTSGITFQEKGVTPPGIDGQDPVVISHNAKTNFVEKLARSLKELTPASGTVVYDPAQTAEITTAINLHQVILVGFKEGDAVGFYGFLRNFEPEEGQDGEQPTASIELVPCGVNAAGAEEGLTYYTTTTTATT